MLGVKLIHVSKRGYCRHIDDPYIHGTLVSGLIMSWTSWKMNYGDVVGPGIQSSMGYWKERFEPCGVYPIKYALRRAVFGTSIISHCVDCSAVWIPQSISTNINRRNIYIYSLYISWMCTSWSCIVSCKVKSIEWQHSMGKLRSSSGNWQPPCLTRW